MCNMVSRFLYQISLSLYLLTDFMEIARKSFAHTSVKKLVMFFGHYDTICDHAG